MDVPSSAFVDEKALVRAEEASEGGLQHSLGG